MGNFVIHPADRSGNCCGLLPPSSLQYIKANISAERLGAGRQLPRCVQLILAPHFPTLVLGRIRIYTQIPWAVQQLARIPIKAITVDEEIYYAPGMYDPDTWAGITSIAHELTHTQQYKYYSTIVGFGWDYWAEFDRNKEAGMSDEDAYTNIRFEVEARANADRIIQLCLGKYDGQQPCVNGVPNLLKPQPQRPAGYWAEIEACQRVLLTLGYLTDQKYVDGIWGPRTRKALIQFQDRNGLKTDGIIGRDVKTKIAQPLNTLRRAR
jgi:hypothetical protein